MLHISTAPEHFENVSNSEFDPIFEVARSIPSFSLTPSLINTHSVFPSQVGDGDHRWPGVSACFPDYQLHNLFHLKIQPHHKILFFSPQMLPLNCMQSNHLIFESVIALWTLEGHVVAVHNLLVRPQGVLCLKLLVTNLTRKVGFWTLASFTFDIQCCIYKWCIQNGAIWWCAKYACLARKTVAMISLLLVLV